jgi:DeoR family transcriptional regulator, suf operon transcriptional repressor
MAPAMPDRVAPPLPEGRRNVLYAVRRRGEATAEQVAETLGMTVSGARQHLSALVDIGLAEAHEAPEPTGKRGRRTLVYSVTRDGDALFPKAYGELTNELLGFLDDEAPATVNRLFARRRDARTANALDRLATVEGLEARVDELTRILDEDGYLASWTAQPDGSFLIVEHNCAIWAVATRYGQACSSEIEFIQTVLEPAHVERTSHMIDGDRRCAYRVTPARP